MPPADTDSAIYLDKPEAVDRFLDEVSDVKEIALDIAFSTAYISCRYPRATAARSSTLFQSGLRPNSATSSRAKP